MDDWIFMLVFFSLLSFSRCPVLSPPPDNGLEVYFEAAQIHKASVFEAKVGTRKETR